MPSEIMTLKHPGVVTNDNSDDAADVAKVPCELTISCDRPMYPMEVTAVDVLCDARHLEVYTGRPLYKSNNS